VRRRRRRRRRRRWKRLEVPGQLLKKWRNYF